MVSKDITSISKEDICVVDDIFSKEIGDEISNIFKKVFFGGEKLISLRLYAKLKVVER